TRHPGALDAQQGQPAGRAVRAPGGTGQGRRQSPRGGRMSTAANCIALGTIVRREFRRITRIWSQTLIPPAITTTLYLIIFGKVVGSRVGMMEGFPYIEYLVPGMVMMVVIRNS